MAHETNPTGPYPLELFHERTARYEARMAEQEAIWQAERMASRGMSGDGTPLIRGESLDVLPAVAPNILSTNQPLIISEGNQAPEFFIEAAS